MIKYQKQTNDSQLQLLYLNHRNMQKNKDFFLLFDVSFNSIYNFYQSYLAYTLIMILNLVIYIPTLYGLINPSFIRSLYQYYQIIQFCLFGFIILFVVFFIISYCKNLFIQVRNYFYLVLQAMAILYFHVSFQCFGGQGWCSNQPIGQIISLLTMAIYLSIVSSLRIFFYYPYIDITNFMSMKVNYFGLYLLFYKFLLSISVNFYLLDGIQKSCCFLITIVFYGLKNRKTHCNEYVGRLWSATNILVDWTITIIFILPYAQLLVVNGDAGLQDNETVFWYIWGYTTPFIIALGIIESHVKYNWEDLFKCSIHKIQYQILHQRVSDLKIFIEKLRKSQLKTNSQQFKKLWQLILTHHKVCRQIGCSLQNLRDYPVQRNNQFQQQKRLNKTLQYCLQFGKNFLENQINDNPTDLRLSIQIANYQFEAMHNKQAGLVLFNQFYNKDLSLQNKYALFYLKKKIEMIYVQNQSENGYTNKANAESQIQQFRHNIQVSVAMLGQFWYFLADPKCNLKKLYDLANVLFPLKIGVDKDWEKIEKLRNIESYHLYAKYLIKMFNDKQKGLKILEKANMIEQQLRNKQEVQLDLENSNIVPQENGIIFLQFDGINSGVMYQVNLAAQRMFGYNKGQLLDRKVNDIMPRIYSQYHDRILENYQQTNKAMMMNKQRAVIGKSKNGYLFPFTIMIKPVRNLYSQTAEVYANVRRQLWVKQVGYILLDIDDNISQVSASLLAIFPTVQGRNFSKKKMHITEIIADFQEIKKTCLDRQPFQLSIKRTIETKQFKEITQDATFSIHIEPVSIAIAGRIGYIIKLSKLNTNPAKTTGNYSFEANNNTQIAEFNFFSKFHEGMGIQNPKNQSKTQENLINFGYQGGIVPKSRGNKDNSLLKQTNLQSLFLSSLQSTRLNNISKQAVKKNYAEGIKIKRLQNRGFRQIHDDDNEDIEFDTANNNHQEENQQMQLSKIMIRPSELSLILSKDVNNKYVFILKIISFLLLLVSSCLCVGQYLYKMFSMNDIISSIQQLEQITQAHSEVIYMKMHLMQYILFGAPSPMTQFTSQIQELDSYIHNNIFSEKIKIAYSDKSFEDIFLNFALNKLVSEANSLKSLAGSQFKLNASNVFFINYNSINGLSIGLQTMQQKFLQTCSSKYQTIRIVLYIFLALAFTFFLIGLVAKNILLSILLKKKSQILQIFFEIPRRSCQTIQKQCEKFIQKLSLEQENVSMDSAISEDDLLQSKSKTKQKQKKRNVIGEEKTTKHFLMATIVFLIILVIYQTVAIIITESNRQKYQLQTQSIFNTFKLESKLTTLMNAMNSYVLDPTIPILQAKDSISKIKELEINSNQLVKQLAINFFNLQKLYDSDYINNYKNIMYESLCNSSIDCYEQYGQKTGLNSIFYNYLNQIKLKYNQIVQKNATNLLQKSQIIKQRQIQLLMKQFWRSLCDIVKKGFNKQANIQNTILFSIMIGICVLNFTVLMIGWWKFYQSLQSKIIATQYILTFIPIDQINKNPKIANYIKSQILDNR